MRTATATPPPFPFRRQNRSNILRDNCFNVLLAAHWHGSKQSSDQDCKNFRSIHRAILQCSADVGNAVARSRRKTVLLEWLRSPPTQQYSKVSVTFSIALFIICGVSPLKEPVLNASRGDVVGRYAQMRDATRVHERALFAVPRIPSELELQARWFAGDFGREFVSTNGDQIEIVQFGVWNREAGPDFRDAAIRINGGEAIHGSIEIDLLDRSWESHGHATNPAFETTALHVFVERSGRAFFTRTLSNRNVPQVCIDLTSLPEAFNANIPLHGPGGVRRR